MPILFRASVLYHIKIKGEISKFKWHVKKRGPGAFL
jgi:hypothetical protein